MNEINYYDLNPSQEVVKLQCKYCLYKRVINIISSVSTDRDIDTNIMTNALNKLIERHDCMRIRFVKKDKKLQQYFLDSYKLDSVPFVEFATEKEQNDFILNLRKKPIKYKKGVVFEPYFCRTFDGKFMILLKVCHLILDIYGLNVIYNDLFDIYDALVENKEMPALPAKFEDVVKKDLAGQNNEKSIQTSREFFADLLSKKSHPSYAGIPGPDEPIWKKQHQKGKKSMKMFFVHNDTEGHAHIIDSSIVERAMKYCEEKKCTLSNFFFYAMNITCSRINGDVEVMLPLELCNCRGTMTEKKAAGTKAQSVGCLVEVHKEQTFKTNFEKFCNEQTALYRHIAFPDTEFEMMWHKQYDEPLLRTFYSLTFSFIPMKNRKDMDFQIYSNGKGALLAYIAMMWDVDTNQITVAYDCQTKTHSAEAVKKYHLALLSVLDQILNNEEIKIQDIEVDYE